MKQDPITGRLVAQNEEERFRAGHDASGGPDACHVWLRSTDDGGYGWFTGFGEKKAHRAAWVRAHGPVPDGMHVLHRCDNPPCVNEAHLFLGDQVVNGADMARKGRAFRPLGDLNGLRRHPESACKGEKNGTAKLTDTKVREAFSLRAAGLSQRAIGERLGVEQTIISRVLRRMIWKHVAL